MFGYIRPQKPDLLVREYEEYSGIYCTLCRRLGKDFGPAARLVLNYDCTFYAILLLAVTNENELKFRKGRCVVNPLKKCFFCPEDNAALASASALTVILAYFKLRDNIADSGFFRSVPYRLIFPSFFFRNRSAARKFPDLEQTVSFAIAEQNRLELAQSSEIDACAEPTANMLAQIFERNSSGAEKRVLHELGYYLGRWTYLIDAVDDLAKDVSQKTFNPFIKRFHLSGESTEQNFAEARSYANEVLNGTLAKLGAAANLLECGQFGPIIHNIVFLGLPHMQKERLFAKENGDV